MQHAAGIDLHAKPGDAVRAGQPLFTLLADEPARFARALEALEGAWTIGVRTTPARRRPARRRADHGLSAAASARHICTDSHANFARPRLRARTPTCRSTRPATPTCEGVVDIRSLPKVSLHDHLDGGLRPQTIIELADAIGLEVPESRRRRRSADWFAEKSDSGSLVEYLKTFDLTTAVMQTREGLTRVAREFVQDLAADGVIYGEIRWAPEQHLARGLSASTRSVEAVQDGHRGGRSTTREQAGPRHPRRPARHRDAPRRPRRSRSPSSPSRAPRPRGRRLRHRRARGRLPAVAAQGRVRLPRVGVLPGDRARRRGRRARLASAAPSSTAARCASATACASPRTSTIARAQDDESTTCTLGDRRPVGARPRDRARAEPVVEPADRRDRARGATSSSTTRSTCSTSSASAVTVNTDNRTMSRTSLTRELALLGDDLRATTSTTSRRSSSTPPRPPSCRSRSARSSSS